MGSGSSTPTTTTVNQNTSSLPAYAQPYYMGLMNQAQGLTDTTKPPPVYGKTATKQADGSYTYAAGPAPYDWATPGQRIQGYTPQQQQVQNNILGQQLPGQFQAGSQLAATAGLGALQASQYNPSQFGSQQVQGPNLNYFQMQGPQEFGGAQAQQYMSPYMQSVVDVQKQQAIRDAQQGQLAANLGAVRQGTYGGARQLLAGTERERNLGNQLGQIQATGLQNAYQSAQQQFNTQQAAQQQAAQQNLNAALGVQGLGAQYGTQAALANQQSNLEAQRLAEQSGQFGATLGLQGLQQANQSAQTLGNLGSSQQQAQQALYGQQQQTAAQQQALQQQLLDTAYQDYMRQQNYPMEQLQQYSSLLHGVPVAANTTSTISAPGPSLGAQLMGTGLTALSAYNMAK